MVLHKSDNKTPVCLGEKNSAAKDPTFTIITTSLSMSAGRGFANTKANNMYKEFLDANIAKQS